MSKKNRYDLLNIIQVEQDLAMCAEKFPTLICIPIATQFMDENLIALFSFEESEKGISISSEKHYRLVPHEDLSEEELLSYRNRSK
jgi:hypothetical protein